jgi:hypothetical protein
MTIAFDPCQVGAMRSLAAALVVSALILPVQAQEVFSLQKCGTLAVPRQRHASIVANERLYVIGGQTSEGFTTSVQSAPLVQGYKIGQWRDEAPLAIPRAYLGSCVQLVGSGIYIIGGSTMRPAKGGESAEQRQVRLGDTLWTTMGAGGVLGPWKQGPNIPGGQLSCSATCSDDHTIVVSGGSEHEGICQDIKVSAIGPDGTPGAWKQAGKLPVPLWYHGCGLLNGNIYVWGGLTTRERNSLNQKVWSARFTGDGIGEWKEEPQQMSSPVYAAGFCSGANCLVCVAGKYANEYPTNSIWFTTIKNDIVQPWTLLKTDLAAWANLAVAVDKPTGRCFVTGGTYQTAPKSGQPIVDQVAAFQIPTK